MVLGLKSNLITSLKMNLTYPAKLSRRVTVFNLKAMAISRLKSSHLNDALNVNVL